MKEFKKDEAMTFKKCLENYLEGNTEFTTYYKGNDDWIELNENIKDLNPSIIDTYEEGEPELFKNNIHYSWCKSYGIENTNIRFYTYEDMYENNCLKLYFTKRR